MTSYVVKVGWVEFTKPNTNQGIIPPNPPWKGGNNDILCSKSRPLWSLQNPTPIKE